MNTLSISLGLTKFNPCFANARFITHSSDGKSEECTRRNVAVGDENKYKILDSLNKGYAIATLIQADTKLGLSTVRGWLVKLTEEGLVTMVKGNPKKHIPHRYFAV